MGEPDFRALFESLPGLYLVLLPDPPRFTIVAASDGYLGATGAERDALTGKGLLEVCPASAAAATGDEMRNLRDSLQRVVLHRQADAMAVQRYLVGRQDAEGGGREERSWNVINAPLLDAAGNLSHIVHCVEDVTELLRLKRQGDGQVRQNAALRLRREELEAELLLRGRQLRKAGDQLREASQRQAQQGEAQFRELFEVMPQLGWTARPDGTIDFYNRRWYAYTGTTLEQMRGGGWQAIHDPEILPRVIEQWTRSLASGTPFEMEFPLRRHDGAFRWFLNRATPLRDSEGQIVRWVGINTDIHDRRQASSMSDARLRLLVDSIRDYGVFMLDVYGRVMTWSPGAEQLKQYRADEILGRHLSIFYPEEANGAGKAELELRVASSVGRFEDEGWRVRKDGTRFWASVVISAVRDEGGTLVGFAKVTRDLTERKRAEEERVQLAVAQAAEEHFRVLAEASDVLSSSLDYEATLDALARLVVPRYGDWCAIELLADDGTIQVVAMAHVDPAKVEVARQLQRRWPTDRDAATGTPKVLRTGQSELYGVISDELLVAGTRDAEQLRLARELRLRSALVVPINARGKTIGALTLVWAETERNYVREDLPRVEELARRAGIAIENARLYLQAQNAVQLRDEFLSIASHELRTPLTTMQLQLSGLQRGLRKPEPPPRDKVGERVDVIDQQLQRLTGLVNGLLDVSRATAGRVRLELEDVDLGAVIDEAVGRLKTNLDDAGCTVSIEVEAAIVGRWDRMRVDQVVTNFVTNAMKYGAGKPIEIRAWRTPHATALLSVRDHGIGVSPSEQKRIFERFGRAVPAENYGGLGLGLWIAKECVAAMGGRITVESELGRGALFTTELPLARTEDQPSVH
jgi:PAS domain S-box-containing protein